MASVGICILFLILRESIQSFTFKLLPLFCSSVTKSHLTLCEPKDYSMPGFPVLHHLPELDQAQTQTHWNSDAIQSSCPLWSPSPPDLSLSQHQGLFHWGGCLHQVAKVLELKFQHQSFQWIFRPDSGLISLLSKGLSRVFSSTTVWKHRIFGAQPSLWSNFHICIWLLYN